MVEIQFLLVLNQNRTASVKIIVLGLYKNIESQVF